MTTDQVSELANASDPATIFDRTEVQQLGRAFSIADASRAVVAAYDRDGDGAIAIDVGGQSELERSAGGVRRSIERLARAADADRDGRATAAEIAAIMSRYDLGIFDASHDPSRGDGWLTAEERARFLADYGEQHMWPVADFHAERLQLAAGR